MLNNSKAVDRKPRTLVSKFSKPQARKNSNIHTNQDSIITKKEFIDPLNSSYNPSEQKTEIKNPHANHTRTLSEDCTSLDNGPVSEWIRVKKQSSKYDDSGAGLVNKSNNTGAFNDA